LLNHSLKRHFLLKHTLIDNVGGDVQDETVEDAWNDMANYAIMAVMCRQGMWPGAEKPKEMR
jgi:hypothetical protein